MHLIKKITLFLLCISSTPIIAMGNRTSCVPAAEVKTFQEQTLAPGEAYEEITPPIKGTHQSSTFEVRLLQKPDNKDQKPVLIGKVACKVYGSSQTACIKDLEINSEKHWGKGYGTRLFKQAITQMHQKYPLYRIEFNAYPFYDMFNPETHKKLIQFYKKLGAVVAHKVDLDLGTDMVYPLELAAMLSVLMPILEPTPQVSKKDALRTIIEYIGIIPPLKLSAGISTQGNRKKNSIKKTQK